MMSITNQLSTTALCIIIALGCTTIVSASYSSTTTEQQTFIELQQKLSPGPGDVIENLEDYDKVSDERVCCLFIHIAPIVWQWVCY